MHTGTQLKSLGAQHGQQLALRLCLAWVRWRWEGADRVWEVERPVSTVGEPGS